MIIDVDCIGFQPSYVGQRPAEQIRDLGIQYDKWESHPMFDCIRIIGCRNVPADLPYWYQVRSDLA